MFNRNKRSRHFIPLTLAVSLLTASLAALSTLTLADHRARDTTRTAPEWAIPHHTPEPVPVSQSGFELISNHLR
ncbi:hypothetical protein GPA27_21385 [Aromatoleum toluolicum]|uniref:Uncharacterized protein n=1 Tax=Aromatoleum toluolicum TaxID=90060 RepID=A0ABX1NKR4_9RHOO|nr:hypothetical protein [Aromatoleum toluolicum]NMF99931.1 hypothetical protein [Aromatoleum toluolicum]